MAPIENLNKDALLNLKISSNPASKLFNWNMIVKELENIGVTVD